MREGGRLISCGGSAEKGWRTELDLGRRKPLDDHHAPATFGTAPERARVLGKGCFWFDLRLRYRAEQLKAKRQGSGAAPVSEEAEMADADEAFGKQMQQSDKAYRPRSRLF